MAIVYNENIVRIRISNTCASNCAFCLDKSNIDKKELVNEDEIFEQIDNGFKPDMKNKIVISGGEASINPNFLKYIEYAKNKGYYKIQTITNGLRWANINFCKKAIDAGLHEITFSLHGHTSKLHDSLTQTPNSFKKIIKAITNFRRHYPNIIVNADICINKQNIKYTYKIVQLLKKLNVWEYDILQVIPFEAAWQNKEKMLFEDIYEYEKYLSLLWNESYDKRVHMWANRVFPPLLEKYEHMIQTPEKIYDEVLGEAKESWIKDFSKNKLPYCKDNFRCQNCYLNWFCSEYNEYLSNKTNLKNKNNYYKLYTSKDIYEINKKYPEKVNDFINNLKESTKDKEYIYNIPFCILSKNNLFTTYKDYLEENPQLENNFYNFTEWFMNEGFRVKSKRCDNCIYNDRCKGLHINLIKKYGFKILKPFSDENK